MIGTAVEWSDIRIFLQVVRGGTMAAATMALRMDHSTISRRIARLEEHTGVRLFERAGRRLALTSEGEKLVLAAEKLDSIVVREVLNLSEDGDRVIGPVRIGTTEEFGLHYLAPRLACLTEAHPDLEIELVAQPQTLSLAARDVDLLVALDRPVAGDIRYKKLTDVEFGIYAGGGYFDDRQRPNRIEDLVRETWCGHIKELLPSPELEMFSGVDEITTKYRSSSITVQLGAVSTGYALATLPCFVASKDGNLERLLSKEATFERSYWLAVHEDLARYPRVRAVMRALEAQVGQDRALFRPTAASGGEADRPAARIHNLFDLPPGNGHPVTAPPRPGRTAPRARSAHV